MKTVAIRCEHNTTEMQLHISESNMCCIQCGLIQIALSSTQVARVKGFCDCMLSKLQFTSPPNQRRVTMTIDPSQLDLRGEYVSSWLIG
jgi:hypothetical protein